MSSLPGCCVLGNVDVFFDAMLCNAICVDVEWNDDGWISCRPILSFVSQSGMSRGARVSIEIKFKAKWDESMSTILRER